MHPQKDKQKAHTDRHTEGTHRLLVHNLHPGHVELILPPPTRNSHQASNSMPLPHPSIALSAPDLSHWSARRLNLKLPPAFASVAVKRLQVGSGSESGSLFGMWRMTLLEVLKAC